MSTVYVPEAAPPQVPTQGEPPRFVPIYANLLPDEIVAGRRARQTMRRVIIGLGAVVVLLVGWYGLSIVQTSTAKNDLTKAQSETIRLQNQIKSYAPLMTAQAQSAAISTSLTTLMKTDLQWAELIRTLLKNAPAGIKFETISGNVPTGIGATGAIPAGQTGGLGVLNDSGKLQVGTLTISGTAPDRSAVAAFVERLGKIDGLTAPFPASVTSSGGPGVKFSTTVLITSDLLGGRFAAKPGTTTPEGK